MGAVPGVVEGTALGPLAVEPLAFEPGSRTGMDYASHPGQPMNVVVGEPVGYRAHRAPAGFGSVVNSSLRSRP
jgi:hypothetical protein